MSVLRALFVGGGLLLGTVAATGTASAQVSCYPNCTLSITLDDNVVVPGQTLTTTVTGLDIGTGATGTVNSTPVALGTKTVPASGIVAFTFQVPNDFIGQHSVTVQGTRFGAPVSLNAPFTVVAATAGGGSNKPGGNLVRTGAASTLPLGQAGIALLAAGGGAVYVAKRRRRVAPTA